MNFNSFIRIIYKITQIYRNNNNYVFDNESKSLSFTKPIAGQKHTTPAQPTAQPIHKINKIKYNNNNGLRRSLPPTTLQKINKINKNKNNKTEQQQRQPPKQPLSSERNKSKRNKNIKKYKYKKKKYGESAICANPKNTRRTQCKT